MNHPKLRTDAVGGGHDGWRYRLRRLPVPSRLKAAACAAVFTSPVRTFAAHPKNILANPAVEVIKSIPSVWDETRVLLFREIGGTAAFARRRELVPRRHERAGSKGVHSPARVPGRGRYRATLARDKPEAVAAVVLENVSVGKGDRLTMKMRAGGGFVGRFVR